MSIELKNELVSVIIPIYNSQDFLHESIYSVLNQKYKNIEVILVDDGSTDNSIEICEKIAAQDKRVKVFKQSNKGPGSARNNGILSSIGKYIVFIDSDDVADSLLVQNLVELNTNNKTQLTICGIKVFQNDFKEKDIIKIQNKINSDKHILEMKEYLEYLVIHKTNIYFGAPYGKLFSRDIIIENNIRFDEHSNVAEDFMFNVNYYNYVKNVSVLADNLYYHRADNLNSISKAPKDTLELWGRYKQVFFNYEKLLKKHDINPNNINNFVIYSIYKILLNYSKELLFREKTNFKTINNFSATILNDEVVSNIKNKTTAESTKEKIVNYAVNNNNKSIINCIIIIRHLIYKIRKY